MVFMVLFFSTIQGNFVGLKNLGATCYVNTFLQLWFHNPTVRRAVYEWRDSASDDEYSEFYLFMMVNCLF